VPAGATAFTGRDMTFATVIAGMWPDPSANEAGIAWVRDYYQALRPHSASGGYVNFMSEDDRDHARDDYRDAYARLALIKKTYDPGNLFRLNQNIEPAG
jgi:FAD/FMN-containing dehydrogenase